MVSKLTKSPPAPASKKGSLRKAVGGVINYSGGIIDRLMGRLISRKLVVWAAATLALCNGMLTSSDWVAVSLVYIGSQAAVDLASKWKGA